MIPAATLRVQSGQLGGHSVAFQSGPTTLRSLFICPAVNQHTHTNRCVNMYMPSVRTAPASCFNHAEASLTIQERVVYVLVRL